MSNYFTIAVDLIGFGVYKVKSSVFSFVSFDQIAQIFGHFLMMFEKRIYRSSFQSWTNVRKKRHKKSKHI